MSDEKLSVDSSKISTDGTVPFYSNWFIILGAWGLLLAVLNMMSMAHPTQHISWGGLLTFEATNAAFGEAKDGFHFEIWGDSIFMAICLALIFFGFKPINESGNLSAWFRGLVINDTWTALGDMTIGGGQRTMAAWCLLLGFVFYFWFGIQHDGWIDVGVYSVSIALIATGFALNHASRVPPGDENID